MRYKVQWTYKRNNVETVLYSDFEPLEKVLQLATDFEKTGRVKQLVFYDEIGTSWTKKEVEKLAKQEDEVPHDIILYFDGGYDIQSKQAGIGIALYYKKNGKTYRIRRNNFLQELENNNEAEYAALLFGLQILEEIGVQYDLITLRGDSQVVLNQISGEWPCYEENLNRYCERIEKQSSTNRWKLICEPISRKNNREVHQLASQALEGMKIDSHAVVEEFMQ